MKIQAITSLSISTDTSDKIKTLNLDSNIYTYGDWPAVNTPEYFCTASGP